MSQNREKEETLDLKLSSTTTTLCPPENCKLSAPTTTTAQICAASGSGSGSTSPDSARPDPAVIRPPTDPDTPAAESPDPVPAKKAVNRCLCCAKRVGLTGFRCRCGELFCSVHRYSDRHDCSYDYKAAGRDAIARENPVVRAAKILKV